MATAKLIIVFVLILIALRKRAPVGLTLFGAGILTAFLSQVEWNTLSDGYWALITSGRFISLTAAICLITTMGVLLKELGFLQKLGDSCRGLSGGNKTAATVLPPLVGMMPMPGGALLSAPLVDSLLSHQKYQPQFKSAVNYYFRHVIEHFWPIYPGIIVTEAVTGLAVRKVALLQVPLAVVMLALGYLFFIQRVDNSSNQRKNLRQSLKGIVMALWPILVAVAVYGLLQIDLSLAILITILVMFIAVRPDGKIIVIALKRGLSYKLVFLVFGILSFQTALELSGAVAGLRQFSLDYRLPEELVIIIVCFASGLLTGMFAAFVALGYGLLAGFLYQPTIVPAHIFLAFLSGYIGMMLSPAHLCLIVTNDYFRSDLLKVYRVIIWPLLLLGIFGYLIFLSPWSKIVQP